MTPRRRCAIEDQTNDLHFRGYRSEMINLGKKLMLLSVFLTLIPGSALAVNYKKDYCGGADYVGNAGGKYPHLHCGKTVFTLSRSKTNHINFHDKTNCNKVNEVLGDQTRNYGSANNAKAITTALQAYQAAGCP